MVLTLLTLAAIPLSVIPEWGANETMFGDLPAYHESLWPVGMDVLPASSPGRDVGEALIALATPVPTPAEVPILPQTERVEVRPRNETAIPGRTQAGSVSVRATWYGLEDGYGVEPGKLITASGERFDPDGLTAASRTYKLGTELSVCYAGVCVGVRVNDRCGACTLDLSRGAFELLAPLSRGVIQVEARVME